MSRVKKVVNNEEVKEVEGRVWINEFGADMVKNLTVGWCIILKEDGFVLFGGVFIGVGAIEIDKVG